jgi:tRNA(His) guanylyltransferase
MKDDLGERMKGQYEDRTRYFVPRRTYTIIRLDGKAFHTYTKGLNKPFDKGLHEDMDNAIIATLPHIQGAVFAYTQSDEISVLVTDFFSPDTSAWFDGNVQKMSSVSSSVLTAEFNKIRWNRYIQKQSTNLLSDENSTAFFDSRVFTIPDRTEVMNYFIWRNKDCSRNSVSMIAQSIFSHKELQGQSTTDMHEMLADHAVMWNVDYSEGEKYGRLIVKEKYIADIQFSGVSLLPDGMSMSGQGVERSRWISKEAWKFTENKDKLLNMIPKYD